ncbi:MAG: hypothetical protein J6T67_03320 [Paludibacteraceae bacterium]|nr:hypothetical protein [Paludibacteraceae bacterium]MBR4712657.1 hypothetical protein [Paludibacteraceae bacterium]
MMNFLLEIAKISIPGILVLLAAYYILRDLLRNAERTRFYEMKKESAKALTPVKLTAYERLALFLERMKPESLLIRTQAPNMTVHELHIVLLNTIREEFEHNVTQQIYVGNDVWLLTRNAKDSLIQLINTIASDMPDDVPALELSKMIIERYNAVNETPIDLALSALKSEVKSFK